MAASDAIPVPRKNTAYRYYFAIRKPADSTLITTWTGMDSEVSLDGASFNDCTNEATEIGTSGCGYIDLTASEMNADAVTLKITVTNTGAVPLVFVLYPESAGDYRVSDTQKVDIETIKTNPVVNAGTITFPTGATLASTTNITSASGISLAADQAVNVTKWGGSTTPVTNLTTVFSTDFATVYDSTNKAFLSKLGNFAMGGSSLALTTGDIDVLGHLGVTGMIYTESSFVADVGCDFGNVTIGSIGISGAITATNASNNLTLGTFTVTTNAISWNSSWDTEVQSECSDALVAFFTSVANLVDLVWDEATSGHTTAGTTGKALIDSSSAGDPWSTTLPGAYGTGTAGKIIGDNLNATVSSRSSHSAADVWSAGTRTLTSFGFTVTTSDSANITAILADTDELQTDWTNNGRLDNILDARASQTTANMIYSSTISAVGAVTTGATTTVIPTNMSPTADSYNDQLLLFTSGNLTGRVMPILSNTSGGVFTMGEAFHAAPSDGSSFHILPTHTHPVSQIQSGLATSTNVSDAQTAIITQVDANETKIDTLITYVDTEVSAIKTKTDQLTFTVANQVDANALSGGGLDAAGVRSAIGLASANLDSQLSTIDDFLDTEIAAIKAKTDNLPSDPADASDISSAFSSINSTLSTIAAYIDTEVAAIKAKTDNLPSDPADASDITASFLSISSTLSTIASYIDTEVAAIKAKTDNLPSDPADQSAIEAAITAAQTAIITQIDDNETKIDAIKSKTDNLPSDPADASDIAASFTTVNSKLDTIDDYIDTEIAAIKAKTDLITVPPTTSDIATAVFTTTMTEAYPSDGSEFTLAQALYLLYSTFAQFTISGTTITCKKLDGSTTSATFTMDSSTTPTSRVRSS